MNWDRFEGHWRQIKGRVQEHWGQLTDDDIDVVDGRREQLSGKLQARYGRATERAEAEIAARERRATGDGFRH